MTAPKKDIPEIINVTDRASARELMTRTLSQLQAGEIDEKQAKVTSDIIRQFLQTLKEAEQEEENKKDWKSFNIF